MNIGFHSRRAYYCYLLVIYLMIVVESSYAYTILGCYGNALCSVRPQPENYVLRAKTALVMSLPSISLNLNLVD